MTLPKHKLKVDVLVKPRSLYVLSGPARTDWQHGIESKITHKCNGVELIRTGTRDSLTYRRILPAMLPVIRAKALAKESSKKLKTK